MKDAAMSRGKRRVRALHLASLVEILAIAPATAQDYPNLKVE